MTEPSKDDRREREERRKRVIVIGSPIDKMAAAQSHLLDARLRYFHELLGNRVDEMLKSREATERMIADPDPKIRHGVYAMLALHWEPDASLEDTYRHAVLSDPDFKVKVAAMTCLAGLYSHSKNREVSTIFARIVRNESNSLVLRRAAYLGLCKVQEIRVSIKFLKTFDQCTDDLPNELDWAMVDSFLK